MWFGRTPVVGDCFCLSKNYPDVKGFSAQNIWRMKQFYETYKEDEKLSPLVRELNWTNNLEKNILRQKLHEFYELADHCQTLYLEEQGEVEK